MSVSESYEKAMVLRNVTKKYGDFTAVQNLSLDIFRGEVFGLLGPNGSGKSTTIRTCLGLLSKTAGDISLLGLDSHKDSIEIRRRTGYLPGDFGLVPGVKVRTLLRYLLKLSSAASEKKMFELSERLELDMGRKTNELSKGNRQKVGIVQSFMADQELIILDEPTSGLDPLVQKEFYSILEEERRSGKTIFMSSHVLAEVEAVCDRVAIIREGRLVLLDSIQNLKNITGKVLEVTLSEAVGEEVFAIQGVGDLCFEGNKVSMTITDNLDAVIKKIAEYGILNMSLGTYSLDQLFLKYYSSGTAGDAIAEKDEGKKAHTGEGSTEKDEGKKAHTGEGSTEKDDGAAKDLGVVRG